MTCPARERTVGGLAVTQRISTEQAARHDGIPALWGTYRRSTNSPNTTRKDGGMSESPKSPKSRRSAAEWARVCASLARIANYTGTALLALSKILKEIETLRPNAEGAA